MNNMNNLDIYVITEIMNFLNDHLELSTVKEVCKLFYELTKKRKSKKIHISEVINSIPLLEWAKKHKNFKYTHDSLKFASRQGDLKIIKYLVKDGCAFEPNCYREAAQNSHFNIVKWFYKNHFSDENSTIIMQGACESDNLKMIEWMIERQFILTPGCCNAAAFSGNLKVLKLLVEKHGCDFTENTYAYAAEFGHIHILKYLYSISKNDLSKPIWSEDTFQSAAENGQIKTMKFLKKKKCRWNSNSVYFALYNQHIEAFKWLVKNGCPYDEDDIYISRFINAL